MEKLYQLFSLSVPPSDYFISILINHKLNGRFYNPEQQRLQIQRKIQNATYRISAKTIIAIIGLRNEPKNSLNQAPIESIHENGS